MTAMFGQMMVEPVVQLDPGVDLQTAIATLIKIAEIVEIVRWIELPTSVLLFLLVPGDPDSGAVYVLDRKKGTWYARGLRGRTIRRLQRKPARNAPEGVQLPRSH
jgi:hypothetical protein